MDLSLQKRTHAFRSLFPITLILLAIAGLAGCEAHSEEGAVPPPPPAVDVALVQPESVTLWDGFTGRIAARESVDIRPRVSGHIDSVTFEEGAMVKKGDVLFQIDARPYQAALNSARAELGRANSTLEITRSEARRARQLFESSAISREELERRESAMAIATATLQAAQAALDNAALNLEYTHIRSPIEGRASRAFVTAGNLANGSQTLLTRVVSVDPVFVYFESDEQTAINALGRLDNGQMPTVKVRLAGDNGYAMRALVDFVDNRVDAGTGTLQYRAVMANPDGVFRPGQFARVEMPVENLTQALLVDQKAVLTDQDRRYVYVVSEDNTATRRDIEPGRRTDGLLVVRQGLTAGERIVVNGLQKIMMSGMEVAPERVAMRPEEREQQPQIAGAGQ